MGVLCKWGNAEACHYPMPSSCVDHHAAGNTKGVISQPVRNIQARTYGMGVKELTNYHLRTLKNVIRFTKSIKLMTVVWH